MKQFLLNLLSSDSPTSSKRFAALFTLLNAIIMAYIAAAHSNWVCPEFIFNGLLLVIAGLFGYNMAESIFKKKDTKDNTDADQ